MAGNNYKTYEKGFEFSLMLQALDLLADNKDPTIEQKKNIKLMIQKTAKEFRVPVKAIKEQHMHWDQCGVFNQSEISLICDHMGIHPSSISRYPGTLNAEYVHLFWIFTRDQTLYVQENFKSGEIPDRIKENLLDEQYIYNMTSWLQYLYNINDKMFPEIATLFESDENVNINAFKFPKPKQYIPNNFQANTEKPIAQRIKILSEHLNSNIIDKSLQNYLDQAILLKKD